MSQRPEFSLGGSDSCGSLLTDTTQSSSANLLPPEAESRCLPDLGYIQQYDDNYRLPKTTETYNHSCHGNITRTDDECCHSRGRELSNNAYFHRCYGRFSPNLGECHSEHCQSGKLLPMVHSNTQYHTEQCNKVIISFHKLKYFTIFLLCFNVCLIIAFALFCVFYLPNLKFNHPVPETNSPVGDPLTSSKTCELKCRDLANKLGLLYEVEKVDQQCCGMEDIVKYFKTYIDRHGIPNAEKSRPALHLVGGKPSNTPGQSTNFIKDWKWDKSMRVRQTVDFNNDTITILVSGNYFIYSRIHFIIKVKDDGTNQMPITHALYRKKGSTFRHIQSSSLKCSVQNGSTIHSSFLEGLAYVEAGDELKIGLSHGENLEFISKNDNYFGLFKV